MLGALRQQPGMNYALLLALALLTNAPAIAQPIACTEQSVASPHPFERVLCALRTHRFSSAKLSDRQRDHLRRVALTVRSPEKLVPVVYQLAIDGDRLGVERVWRRHSDRVVRFFVAMLYYAKGGGEYEQTTAFVPLPTNGFSGEELAERQHEIDLVAKYRSALAAELVAMLSPFRARLRGFDHLVFRAQQQEGEPLAPHILDELAPSAPNKGLQPTRPALPPG